MDVVTTRIALRPCVVAAHTLLFETQELLWNCQVSRASYPKYIRVHMDEHNFPLLFKAHTGARTTVPNSISLIQPQYLQPTCENRFLLN